MCCFTALCFNCSVVPCCSKRSVPPLFGINGFCFNPSCLEFSRPAIQELSCLSSNCCDFYFSRTVAPAAKFNKFREWSHMRFRAGAKARITRQAKRNMQRRNIDADKSLHKSNIQRPDKRKRSENSGK